MSTRQVGLFLAVALAVLSTSCATAHFVPISAAPPSASIVPPDAVVVLKAPPPSGFQELGDIVLQWKGSPNDEAILRLVRRKASEVGASAVVLVDSFGVGSTDFSADGEAASLRGSMRRSYKFRALRPTVPLSS